MIHVTTKIPRHKLRERGRIVERVDAGGVSYLIVKKKENNLSILNTGKKKTKTKKEKRS